MSRKNFGIQRNDYWNAGVVFDYDSDDDDDDDQQHHLIVRMNPMRMMKNNLMITL